MPLSASLPFRLIRRMMMNNHLSEHFFVKKADCRFPIHSDSGPDTVRIFWAERYNRYINPNGKYQALLGFTDMRERFLQVSHESSTESSSSCS